MYPLIELLTAGVFVATYAVFGSEWLFAIRAVFGASMIVLLVIDLQHQILPNEITLPGIVVGLAASLVAEPGWRDALVGAAAGGGVLWLVAWGYERLRHQEGLGFGDVKMLAMIGAFLGWKLMLLTLVGASIMGSLTAAVLMVSGRAGWQSKLPLGTFLAAVAVPVGLVGTAVVNWYAGFTSWQLAAAGSEAAVVAQVRRSGLRFGGPHSHPAPTRSAPASRAPAAVRREPGVESH